MMNSENEIELSRRTNKTRVKCFVERAIPVVALTAVLTASMLRGRDHFSISVVEASGNLITVCNGQQFNWRGIDDQLKGANYPGSFDHSQSELDAYNRAACPIETQLPTYEPAFETQVANFPGAQIDLPTVTPTFDYPFETQVADWQNNHADQLNAQNKAAFETAVANFPGAQIDLPTTTPTSNYTSSEQTDFIISQ